MVGANNIWKERTCFFLCWSENEVTGEEEEARKRRRDRRGGGEEEEGRWLFAVEGPET